MVTPNLLVRPLVSENDWQLRLFVAPTLIMASATSRLMSEAQAPLHQWTEAFENVDVILNRPKWPTR